MEGKKSQFSMFNGIPKVLYANTRVCSVEYKLIVYEMSLSVCLIYKHRFSWTIKIVFAISPALNPIIIAYDQSQKWHIARPASKS